ncbi:MAG: DnaJ domain-containing protein [Acidobacteriota bacterium]|jgi:hypothetical protein
MNGASLKSGSFAAGEFPAVLRTLVQDLAEGRLDVTVGEVCRSLWLEAGQVRAVTSTAEHEKLGSWLVEQKILSARDMALALARQPEGVLFGKMLVEEGLLDLETLGVELGRLAVRIVSALLAAEGTYTLRGEVRLPVDAAMMDMTTASLILAAYRVVPEEQLPLDGLAPDRFVWTAEDALMRYQAINLAPAEAYLVSRIDGTSTVIQLSRLVGMPKPAMDRTLLGLQAAGIVELRETRAGRPSEPIEVQVPAAALGEESEAQRFTPEQQQEYERVIRLVDECRRQDYYRRLGLDRRASYEEIHRRYAEMTRLFHPDRAREPHLRLLRRDLKEIALALKEAYETLSNSALRAEYDRRLAEHRPPAAPHVDDRKREQARRELAEANVKRAEQLARSGDVGMAVELLDQAVRFDPQPRTLLTLARLEFRNPMWVQRGLDHLRRAVTIDPTFVDAWIELACFWERRQQPAKQRHCLERALENDPTNEWVAATLKALVRKR